MVEKKSKEPFITIDCRYLFPEYAASYLLIEQGRACFIDNNTVHAVPLLLDALKERSVTADRVEYIIVTHVHLDHAGGTSKLAQACPNATVLAHPAAARHLMDPSRLIRGVKAVYGQEMFETLYGKIEPVDRRRVRPMEDRESVTFGGRRLEFIHTLGHARHHVCIYDSGSNGVFAGDSFGIALPAFQTGSAPFVFPSASPPDFDPGEARASIRKILDTGAGVVCPTHFGPMRHVEAGAMIMMHDLDQMEGILEEALGSGMEGRDLDVFCREKMMDFFRTRLEKRGLFLSGETARILKIDIDINAMGIAAAVRKRRAPA